MWMDNTDSQKCMTAAGPAPKASTKYKDSVFRMLFGQLAEAAELYNAFSQEKCTASDIEFITLSNEIFTNFINDLAFLARRRLLVFSEHQSTPNPNLPMRDLMYVGRTYERYFETRQLSRKLYGEALVTFPTPEFIVLYNGQKEMPDVSYLRLSSGFEEQNVSQERFGKLELTVPVYNINYTRNKEIMGRSITLTGYSKFVATTKEYISKRAQEASANKELISREEIIRFAISKAVKFCKENDILAPFFEKHGSEVINVFSQELTIEDFREISHKAGVKKGITKGKVEVAVKMLEKGFPIEQIVEVTNLPAGKIQGLQTNMAKSLNP
jgi:predicted transposase/invertase (TIGR01784 family)